MLSWTEVNLIKGESQVLDEFEARKLAGLRVIVACYDVTSRYVETLDGLDTVVIIFATLDGKVQSVIFENKGV